MLLIANNGLGSLVGGGVVGQVLQNEAGSEETARLGSARLPTLNHIKLTTTLVQLFAPLWRSLEVA